MTTIYRKLLDGGCSFHSATPAADEFAKEHAAGAKHLSRGVLEMKIEQLEPDVNRPIVCYCGGGKRSALAVESLERMGYEDVSSLAGGFKAWKAAGLGVE